MQCKSESANRDRLPRSCAILFPDTMKSVPQTKDANSNSTQVDDMSCVVCSTCASAGLLHVVQMVAEDATAIGCAFKQCPHGTMAQGFLYVCLYGPRTDLSLRPYATKTKGRNSKPDGVSSPQSTAFPGPCF